MEENVRIVVTGDNRDALNKLNKVENAVNRLNSATKKVEVKVNGIQEAERQAARLYQALERVENAALSKLPRSVQLLVAYLKAASQSAQELGSRFAFAAAEAAEIAAPIRIIEANVKDLNRELLITFEAFQRISREAANLRQKALPPGVRGGDLVPSRGGPIVPSRGGPIVPSGGGPIVPFGEGGAVVPYDKGGALARRSDVTLSPLPKTLESLERLRRRLERVYRTTEIGTPKFEQFAERIAQVTKEIEDAQLRFQKVTTKATPGSIAALREDIAAKEAAFNQTKRGTRKFNELADELRRLNTELSKTEKFIEGRTKGRAGRVGTALQSAALGGGFPLLFGGPSFSALGGAAGGFAGGLVGQGTGFALGIVGSAIGSAFDALTQKGLELADALNKPVQSIDTLLDALPRLDTETKGFINELRAAGLEASASAVVVEEFNKRLKEIGITDVEKFKNDAKNFKEAVKDLELAAAGFASNQFLGIIGAIKNLFIDLRDVDFTDPFNRYVNIVEALREGDASRAASNAQTKTTTTGAEPSQTQIEIQKRFVELERNSVQIQRDREALIQNSVNLSADQLAVRQAELNVAEAVNKTERRILEAKNAQNKEAANRAVEEALTAERVARIERDRLKTLREIADIQSGRNIRKLEIAENRNLDKAKIKEIQIRKGRLAGLALERQLTKESVKERIELINIERDEYLLANKGRGLDERINALFDQRVTIARGLATITDEELRKKEELLRLERETDSIRVRTAQRVQLAESADSLQRAQLQLANPFGGDAYERELQRLDQIKELRNIRLQQDAQLLDLQNKLAAADDEDVARIANQIVDQLQVNEIIRDEALARQEVERQILSQQQALEKLQPVVDGITAGFTELFTSTINGSKSAQEVVADTFRQIGEAYINMAAKIIAEQIAMIINERVLAAFRGTTGTGGGGLGSIFGSLFGGQYADGGRPPVGKASLVGERGPELFVPSRSGTIIPNDQLGGSSNTVTVNVDAKGTEVSGNSDQSRQLGAAISRAVQAELVKQQRPGGVLHSSR